MMNVIFFNLFGCAQDVSNTMDKNSDLSDTSVSVEEVEQYYHTSDFRTQDNFPSQRDLTILFHLNGDPIFNSTLSPNGGTFFPILYGSVLQGFIQQMLPMPFP